MQTPAIEMTLKDGTRYQLDRHGTVLARSDGPQGWDYAGQWIICGFLRRANSGWDKIVSLQDALDGEDTGQGWVCDFDHGTARMWGSPSGHRLASVRRIN